VADGDPGAECQIDFGYLGMLTDADDGRRRKVHALIFTTVYSRHMFVWLSYSQTLAAVIAGCQAAWEFFGGVFKVLILDNLKPVIADARCAQPPVHSGVARLRRPCRVPHRPGPARVHSPLLTG
jgi:transposase